MGCLIVLFVLFLPRTIMVVLWLFSDYLSTAYGTWVWPLLGFFILPTTTLGYAVATRRGGEAAPSPGPRILVLPFQNLGAARDAYFSDGITDEITARLAMVRGLLMQHVMASVGTAAVSSLISCS